MQAIIIEDEGHAQKMISDLILKYSKISIAGFAKSVDEALPLISRKQPDVVFLDIHLKDGLGLDLFEQIGAPRFETVFVTAYEQYYREAFDNYAFHYVLKPIDTIKFKLLLQRLESGEFAKAKIASWSSAFYNEPQQCRKIQLHHKTGITLVKLEEIIYMRGRGNYTEIVLAGQRKIMVCKSLVYMMEQVDSPAFLRTHKSYVVNYEHLKGVNNDYTLVLSEDHTVYLSRRHKAKVNSFLKKVSS